MSRTERKQVAGLERLRNSANGNPRYRITFTDGTSAVSVADADFCYGITNPDMRGEVDVTYTKSGKISTMRPAR